MSHAPLAPSGSGKWMNCSASVHVERLIPDEPSNIFCDQGTAAHYVRARCLIDGTSPYEWVDEYVMGGDRLFRVEADWAEALMEGIDRIYELFGDIVRLKEEAPDTILVEERLHFTDKTLKDVYGTLDFGGIMPSWMVVSDLKFGEGVPVDPKENTQQLIYANLYYDFLTLKQRRSIRDVRIIIDQPRHGQGGGEWTLSVDELLRWRDERLYPAVEAVNAARPRFRPSPYACQWCKGRLPGVNQCKAYVEFIEDRLGVDFSDKSPRGNYIRSNVGELSPSERATIVSHRGMIEEFLKNVHASVLADALSGLPTPGLKAIHGRKGARKWRFSNLEEVKARLRSELKDKAEKTTLVSPAEAEKLLPRSIMSELKPYWEQADPNPILVDEDHPKPPIKVEGIEFNDRRKR